MVTYFLDNSYENIYDKTILKTSGKKYSCQKISEHVSLLSSLKRKISKSHITCDIN